MIKKKIMISKNVNKRITKKKNSTKERNENKSYVQTICLNDRAQKKTEVKERSTPNGIISRLHTNTLLASTLSSYCWAVRANHLVLKPDLKKVGIIMNKNYRVYNTMYDVMRSFKKLSKRASASKKQSRNKKLSHRHSFSNPPINTKQRRKIRLQQPYVCTQLAIARIREAGRQSRSRQRRRVDKKSRYYHKIRNYRRKYKYSIARYRLRGKEGKQEESRRQKKLISYRMILISRRIKRERSMPNGVISRLYTRSKQMKLASYRLCKAVINIIQLVTVLINSTDQKPYVCTQLAIATSLKTFDSCNEQPYVPTELAIATKKESQNKLICGLDKNCLLYTSPSPRD